MRATLPLGTTVSLKHGAGGRAMRALIEQLFAEGARQPPGSVGLAEMDDGAAFPVKDGWLVLTTDSHIVAPRFFPGGPAPVRGAAGNTDAHRDREGGPFRLDAQTGNLRPERLEAQHRLGDVRLGEDDDEFVTPEPSGEIALADGVPQMAGDGLQEPRPPR